MVHVTCYATCVFGSQCFHLQLPHAKERFYVPQIIIYYCYFLIFPLLCSNQTVCVVGLASGFRVWALKGGSHFTVNTVLLSDATTIMAKFIIRVLHYISSSCLCMSFTVWIKETWFQKRWITTLVQLINLMRKFNIMFLLIPFYLIFVVFPWLASSFVLTLPLWQIQKRFVWAGLGKGPDFNAGSII